MSSPPAAATAAATTAAVAIAPPSPPDAAGFVLVRGHGPRVEFLLLKAQWGGHWSFPKGHFNRTERRDAAGALRCALRETQEETGVPSDQVQLVGDFSIIAQTRLARPTKNVPSGVKHTRLFLARVRHDTRVVLSKEHTECAWVTHARARFLLRPEMHPALDGAAAAIRREPGLAP
jgi:8-oxo-dGTP pyrophosphatase MutT (NUDIX family)